MKRLASLLVAGGLVAASVAITTPANAATGWGDEPQSCTDPALLGLNAAIANAALEAQQPATVHLGASATIGVTSGIHIPAGASIIIDLCGGHLTITPSDPAAAPGIRVPPGAALTIADSVGGGTLNVELITILDSQAAIGGASGESAGTITIDGGDVTAMVAGGGGAAVGGGRGFRGADGGSPSPGGKGGDGGTVIVNGGSLTAVTVTGGGAAAIGGGSGGAGGTNTAEQEGARGGDGGDGGTLIVNGGSVSAISLGDPLGGTAVGGGGPGPHGLFGTEWGDPGDGAAVVVNGGTLEARSSGVTVGSGYVLSAGAPGSLSVAGDWIAGVTPTSPAPGAGIPASAAPAVTTTGGPERFTLTNGTAAGASTTRIEFVDALVGVLPSTTTPRAGDTITVTARARVPSGSTFDVSSALTLTSSVPDDVIAGNTVTFPHGSPHTITASYGGVSTSFTLEVAALAPAAEDPSELADTGPAPVGPTLAGAMLLTVAGLALAIGPRRRRMRA